MAIELTDAELYEKHADELLSFATFLAGPVLAPDVVASAVLRCLSSAAFRTARNERAYLLRAVANEARMHFRTESRRRRLEERYASAQPQECVDPLPADLLRAVASLSPRQRAVVYLTYWEDQPPDVVGSTLAMSDGAVRRHLARARAKLRRSLDAQL